MGEVLIMDMNECKSIDEDVDEKCDYVKITLSEDGLDEMLIHGATHRIYIRDPKQIVVIRNGD